MRRHGQWNPTQVVSQLELVDWVEKTLRDCREKASDPVRLFVFLSFFSFFDPIGNLAERVCPVQAAAQHFFFFPAGSHASALTMGAPHTDSEPKNSLSISASRPERKHTHTQ